jgi:integrase
MLNLLNKYIESKELAWSATTRRSEYYRLKGLLPSITGDPTLLWDSLKKHKPYSRVTCWIRVCSFWDWLIAKGHKHGNNKYRTFREENRRLFKYAYSRTPAKFSYREVCARIQRIGNDDCQKKAHWILSNGLRVSEFETLKDGVVVGKGGRCREVFHTDLPSPSRPIGYDEFWRELRKVGLKPHDLRKACLTRVVERGANEFELCRIAGWSNLNTASSYIQVNKNRLKELMK